jgi:hypothetical protein
LWRHLVVATGAERNGLIVTTPTTSHHGLELELEPERAAQR